MRSISRADVRLTSEPSASHGSGDLGGAISCCHHVGSRPDGVRSVLSSHEPNGLTRSQSAKVCSVRHAHRHFTTQTRTARRKGASYALASFCGEDSETASGEKFNPNELTAAHPTLPFGTRLRVTNVVNGRSVIVRVNDRGPFVRGRAVDVSSSAAEGIGMIDQGVAKVKLDVIPLTLKQDPVC